MVAVVPLKALDIAKSRLGVVLDADARHDLALSMLARAVTACRDAGLDVCVVSPDETVHEAAVALGVRFLDDGGADLTGAVELALRAHHNAAVIVVLAADLPFVTTADVCALLDAAQPLAIAPAPDGTTNAVAARPPSAFTPSYGAGSAARHGGVHVLRPGLARDLDTPADLERALGSCA